MLRLAANASQKHGGGGVGVGVIQITRRRSVAAVVMSAGGMASIGGAYYYGYAESTLGMRRQGQFWIRVFPIVLDYYWNFAHSSPYVKYLKWRDEGTDEIFAAAKKQQRDEYLEQLHERHAPEMLQVMLDLKGLYIKLGQVLSVAALPIPEPYRVVFRTLQSDVPGWETFDEVVKPVLEKEFQKDLNDIFSFVDPIPCGAASIGQAHRATLKETGEEVIIKVQYPNASWQVPADINCVGDFLKICVWTGVVDENSSKMTFEEFSRQFLAELDYNAERQNLEEIYRSSIQPNSPYLNRGVVVPNVYKEYCTNCVITMTYLPGPKLEEEARRQLELLGIDTKRGIGSIIRENATKNIQDQNQTQDENSLLTVGVIPQNNDWKVKASKVVGNILGVDTILWAVRLARRLVLWSTMTAVATIRVASPILPHSWEIWAESHRSAVEQGARLDLTESWIDALFDVHGHQIFELGLFNADPHPGNILVLDEADNKPSTRLGLIDFGQCKRLSPEERVKVAELILSVANNESDHKIATAFRRLGVQTKNDSTEFLATFARLMFGPLKPQHLDHDWHKRLHELDHLDYFPKELSMVYRTSLLLRGLAFSLQVNSSVGHHWKHHAQAAVDRFGHDKSLAVVQQQQESPKQVMIGGSIMASS